MSVGRSLKAQGHPLSVIAEQLRVLRPEGSHRPFHESLRSHGLSPLRALDVETIQINLGKMCNQTCAHCHVDAGPDRKEKMTWETMRDCLSAIESSRARTVDLTGGAPELHPHFREFVEAIRSLGCHVMDRCNLTILLVKRFEDLPDFFAAHQIEVVASLPCYLEENCDRQRGSGVYAESIEAIRRLNAVGYGHEKSGLRLNLVYNPVGPSLPPNQSQLEADYRRELMQRHGIVFNQLYALANVPISRFLESLLRDGRYDAYMRKLIDAYNPHAAEAVMCRGLISVGWDGRLYDCDFNQMLELELTEGQPRTIRDFHQDLLAGRVIQTGLHCYACTAGAGSSCGGAIAAPAANL